MAATQHADGRGAVTPQAAPRPARRNQPHNPVLRVLRSPLTARLLFPVVVLVFWTASTEIIRRIWPFAVDVLPSPFEVGEFIWAELTLDTVAPDTMYQAFLISLRRLGVGMVIALVLGTVVGLAMGLSRAVNAFFNDWVVAILAMPNLAWALFASLAFGFGNTGPILVVVLSGIPFVIVNVREGVRDTPKELFDMSRSFGVPRARTIRHVLLPSLMPFMFAAIRYSFALGWKGLVVAEVFGGQDGAGWTMKFWYDAHRAHGVVGYAFLFVLFALLVEKLIFERIAKRVFRWRPVASEAQVAEEVFDTAAPTKATAAAAAE